MGGGAVGEVFPNFHFSGKGFHPPEGASHGARQLLADDEIRVG